MNTTAASLLALLDGSGGELTGGALLRMAEERIGQFWSLTRSQVYRELATLEEDGLVEVGEPGARDSRPVRITEPGRSAYRDWLTEHLPGDTIRIPMLLAVAFGSSLENESLGALLSVRRGEHAAALDHYRSLDAELAALGEDGVWARATVSFGILYEEAVLQWFETLPESVRARLG